MTSYRALAPAKVNLGLFVGPVRAHDGKHELATVMQSISLADELTLEHAPAGATQDEIVCPDVPGPPGENLAAKALGAFRAATGWDVGPLRLSIVKRIPLAAGLAGGSADAAAALRLARHASGLGDEQLLRELGAHLGADVPAQVTPGRWLATGAGERLHALPNPPLSVLVLPSAAELSTAAVYAEADRLGLGHSSQELEQRSLELRAAFELGAPLPAARELLRNDLQPAAVSLCPQIDDALAVAREAGASETLVSGSGPTVIGLFAGDRETRSGSPAALERRVPPPIGARSVGGGFAEAVAVPSPGLDARPP
jgi:4-diphosphocytidyl-2-C-methyl-D-erythritol kinase